MSSGLLTGLIGLSGALIGVAGALAADALRHRRQELAHRKSIASTISASIAANISIIDRRDHVHLYSAALPQLDSGLDVNFGDVMDGQPIEAPIARAMIGQIGVLGTDLSGDVVRFFYNLEGLRLDLKALGTGYFGTTTDKAAVIREDLQLWHETRELGLDVVTRLNKLA